jgi:hypothetical protein
MQTDSENLTASESLAIITGMINEAKGHLQKNSFYFLLWGWTIIAAQLGMFILYQIEYRHAYLAWLITIPAWIFTMFKTMTGKRENRITTHFDSISKWLWLSFSFIIFTLVIFGWKINYQLNPVILLITAIPTVVSGIILKFQPLILGGMLFWVGGVASFLLPIEYQPLAGAVAITGGYLIPGYMLKQHP